MNPLFHTGFSISDSLKSVRKSVLIYETIIVAGGAEITGIKDAILQASNSEMALMRQQNTLLQGILAKEFGISQSDIGKAARSYAKDYNQRTGKDAYSFA